MPKQGDTFINAVGVEVVAHGGSTPRPSVIKAGREGQAVNSANVAYDVFGRPYDPSEPVFMTTGTKWLIDRLSFTNAGRTGSPFGVLLDSFALKAYVDAKGWAIGPNEYGMPSAEWMANNQQIVREYGLAPGFGFSYFVQMEGLVGGNVEAGSELSVSVVGNDPDVVIATWSWVVDDVVVATTPTYTPLEADIGKTISCDTEATLLKYGTASTQEYVIQQAPVAPVITVVTNGTLVPGQTLDDLPPPTITVVNPGVPPIDMANFFESRIVDGAAEPGEYVVSAGELVQDRLSGPHVTGTVVVTSTGFTVEAPEVAPVITVVTNGTLVSGQTLGELPPPTVTVVNPGNPPVDMENFSEFRIVDGAAEPDEFVVATGQVVQDRLSGPHATGTVVVTSTGFTVADAPVPVYGPFELAGYLPFFLRPIGYDWEIGYNIDPDPEPEVWVNFRQAMLDPQTDPAFRDYARFRATENGWVEE